MITRLITTYYVEKNNNRAIEITSTIQKNLNSSFDAFSFVISENEEIDQVHPWRVFIEQNPRRPNPKYFIVGHKIPTYLDFFNACEDDCINIIANTDIYFDEFAVAQIKQFYSSLPDDSLRKRICIALSRWDVLDDGTPHHHDHPDSQDCWIFYGKPQINGDTDFPVSKAGCDNHIAYLIKESGYSILNPSQTIRTYHYHNSNVRNYLDDAGVPKETIPPPYYLIHSSK